MRLSQAWAITRHDLTLIRRRRSIFAALIALPVGVALGFPALVHVIAVQSPPVGSATIISFVDAFSFWFVIGGAMLPTSISAYSIVGEKVEKSLEPLLATPSTDGEILLGKVLAAWLPSMIAIWAGAAAYMGLIDAITRGPLGYYYYPNLTIVAQVFVLAPLVAIVAIEGSVAISSRVQDVRSAQQMSGVLFLPLIILYVAAEIQVFPLDARNSLLLAGILAVIGLLLFSLGRRLFDRETILTRWK
ncbi:MAG TPA: ABC transporter permease subunit [Thermoplasmata archaeon]|nr:ABC transporter permease subunit [Thermoplasmata archaeon]